VFGQRATGVIIGRSTWAVMRRADRRRVRDYVRIYRVTQTSTCRMRLVARRCVSLNETGKCRPTDMTVLRPP
jgi:hypothetical protein